MKSSSPNEDDFDLAKLRRDALKSMRPVQQSDDEDDEKLRKAALMSMKKSSPKVEITIGKFSRLVKRKSSPIFRNRNRVVILPNEKCITKESSDDSLSTSTNQNTDFASSSSNDEDSIEDGEITPSDTDKEDSCHSDKSENEKLKKFDLRNKLRKQGFPREKVESQKASVKSRLGFNKKSSAKVEVENSQKDFQNHRVVNVCSNVNKKRKILVKSRSKPDSFSEDTDSFNLSDDNSITRKVESSKANSKMKKVKKSTSKLASSRIVVSRYVSDDISSSDAPPKTNLIKNRKKRPLRSPKSFGIKEIITPCSSIKKRLGWQENKHSKLQTSATRSEDGRLKRKSQREMDEKMRQMKEYNEKVKRRRQEIQKEIDELSS